MHRSQIMEFIEKILYFMFPKWMILDSNHLAKYELQEKNIFRSTISVIMLCSIVVYVAHYFFFDIPMNLKPRHLWFNYRFGISLACLLTFVFYRWKKDFTLKIYKLPAILCGVAICFLQTRTMVWWDQVPYTYSFLFLIITSFSLKLPPFQATLYVSIIYFLSYSSFIEANQNPTMLTSAFIVSIVFSNILASMEFFKVKVFIANQRLFDEQRKNIEQSIEFSKTLKSFLPRKIARRLDTKIAKLNLSIPNAVDDVLRPRSMQISCLSCDIRGYTQQVKNNHLYIKDSVIPMTNVESEIVENHEGIPRKIGDLLFCYFDSTDLIKNIILSNMSGIKIAMNEIEMNTKAKIDIRKQVLITAGEAYVGNIGGIDSAIEITAMGTPVNFLNRLESIVKSKIYLEEIPRSHIILSKEVKTLLETISPCIKFFTHKPHEKGLTIKDFPEVDCFYSYEATIENYEKLDDIIKTYYKHSAKVAA